MMMIMNQRSERTRGIQRGGRDELRVYLEAWWVTRTCETPRAASSSGGLLPSSALSLRSPRGEDPLLFFKYYDATAEEALVRRTPHVSRTDRRDLLPVLRATKGLPADQELPPSTRRSSSRRRCASRCSPRQMDPQGPSAER